jgi:3-oxoacyl-[acyl-carrier protein] reductase
MLLAKRVALVTGVSRGIGRGIALEMARQGADVVVNYARSEKEAGNVARGIQALGRRTLSLKANVSKANQVDAMRERVLKEFDGVDILVNNAGVHHHLKSWEIEDAKWRHVLGVNLDGVFHCSRAFS